MSDPWSASLSDPPRAVWLLVYIHRREYSGRVSVVPIHYDLFHFHSPPLFLSVRLPERFATVMPYLTPGIRSLPQELRDLIFDFAFEQPPPNQLISINATYRPPPHLSICGTLRARTAQHYYSSAVFMFDDPCLGFAWLASVPAEYSKIIQHVDPSPFGEDVGMGFAGEVLPLSTAGGDLMAVDQLLKELRQSWKPRHGVLRVSVRMAVREAERSEMLGMNELGCARVKGERFGTAN